ncbi:hypothetical protein B5C34_06695 [Pacificimonas flava]|uniref:ABC-type transport auxiliary lipoprotein component domain-containing protein n=2 Tax=Pacificimonas TaxID=1960290 RepID=A0A219B471_9SPHN|nr:MULTISPECIES: ABC-type transport auxiliary lipoprotein family protein [Pacificimonas]MBZ6377089.1 membrane integrity-associated transporter subunit PqiC [Pacificimonas aurantium]OWV33180.1 hypothetical protein B5C34_06695 [Pacificimonas flava]
MSPKLVAAALAVSLTACGPIVQIGGGGAPPSSLLALDPARTPEGEPTGAPIMVSLPEVPGKLRTVRIPVTTSSTEVEYLAAATWVEQPNLLFQQLLMDVMAADLGRPVIDEGSVSVVPAMRLSGSLAEFGLDVSGRPEVVVRYDALLTAPHSGFVSSRTFTVRRPVATQTGPAVAAALSEAANEVAGALAAWVAAKAPTPG